MTSNSEENSRLSHSATTQHAIIRVHVVAKDYGSYQMLLAASAFLADVARQGGHAHCYTKGIHSTATHC